MLRALVLRAACGQINRIPRQIKGDDALKLRRQRLGVKALTAACVHEQRAVRRILRGQAGERFDHGRVRAAFQHAAAALKQRPGVERVRRVARRKVDVPFARNVEAVPALADEAVFAPREGRAARRAAQECDRQIVRHAGQPM